MAGSLSGVPALLTPTFTPRQVEVIRLVARGFMIPQIADLLDVSPRTAKAHCDHVRMKLRVRMIREIPEAYYKQTGDDPWPRRKREVQS
jgi:DNA-binding NarL/FixJ family response regulator